MQYILSQYMTSNTALKIQIIFDKRASGQANCKQEYQSQRTKKKTLFTKNKRLGFDTRQVKHESLFKAWACAM